MKHGAGALFLGLVVAAAAPAAPLSAAAAAGKALALHGAPNVSACAVCHGLQGDGKRRQGYPRLAGQDAAYLLHELQSFQNSSRQNGIMQPIAKRLVPLQMREVAAWYAAQPALPPGPVHASAATLARGAELVQHGDGAQGVPACRNCHGVDGLGAGPVFPRLAGQYAGYQETELHNWRRGFRQNDPLGLMRAVAQHVPARDIRAVSVYLASLPNKAPAAVETPMPNETLPYRPLFQPPARNAIPGGPLGVAIREGRQIFDDTPGHAHAYVGASLSCRNCHLESGRKAGSAPMWAAYVAFPAYRSKNHQVNTLAQRVQGCFLFSENGRPPAEHSKTMTDLLAYFAWLAKGAPTGAQMAGRGYPTLPKPPVPANGGRGARVYRGQCAVCHGVDGQGLRVRGQVVFPPLWGPHSFNAGAGMQGVKNAAAFVHANMPYGAPGSLSVQQAYDVAAFIDGASRPPDPRKAGPHAR